MRFASVSTLWITLIVGCCCFSSFGKTFPNYIGVIDAGSTGSRFYLFHLERDSNGEITKMREVNSNECQPGINSYVHNLDGVWKPLYTMIRASERLLHSSDSVPLYIFATAGMRVLSANDQKSIYDAIYRGYRKSNLRFYLSRDNLRTIDGEMEAIYGWLTVNVLKSRITPSLHYTETATISSLDLGGESTQVAYQYRKHPAGDLVDIKNDLFAKSFLSFGAKEAQFRFENYLLSNREAFRDATDHRSNRLHVPNPCNNVGYIGNSPVYEGLFHEGTGNLDQCESLLSMLIRGDSPCKDTAYSKCSIWSMQIPSMDGEFVGMSLYFFVIDFLKTIYQMDDAHPTIDDIKTFGRSFCAMNWTETLEHFSGKHRYTNDVVLGQRCFQIAYIVSLLEHGFRFADISLGATSSLDPAYTIMYLRHINGESVDWTYGAALYEGRKPVPKQVNRILLWSVVLFMLIFVILLVISNRNVAIRYTKLPII